MVKICFDYGHGGRDPGAIYNGRRESMDNLDLGLRVAELVSANGLKIGQTRIIDKDLSLKERVDFANGGNYDYFISFHRNAFKPEVANGAEVFVHPKSSPRARKLAEEIQRGLVACGFRNRGVKIADFYVLRGTKMPAVLLEIGFIDNSLDNLLFDLKREEIIFRITKSIVSATLEKFIY